MANLSKIKREKMLKFLEALKEQHSDDESLKAINQIEYELTAKKYGLVWEELEENVDLKMKNQFPVFTEIKEKALIGKKNDEKCNFLLEGDNLYSLKLLEKTHKGRIDVIYIDPPYNTGNKDFVYNDKYIGKDDIFKHSSWLSFMSKRLMIAFNLLKPDGLIFLSIDDKEQAQLKLLMDEIFSENNFIICMPRITKKSGKTTSAYAKNHDYILVYTKRDQDIFLMEDHVDEAFKFEDEYIKERGKYKLNQTLDYDSLSYSASLDYPIQIDGEIFYPGGDKNKWEERQKGNHRRADWAWRWSKKLFDFGYKNGFIVIKRKNDGTARIYTKTYLNAKIVKNSKGEFTIEHYKRVKATSSISFIDNMYSNDNAKKDLKKLGLKDEFDYSKPVELIKKLIRAYFRKDAVILDFFAGSGTTGQAVLELNNEDGGTRKFILCTNNENEICEKVTYERLKGVITGECVDGTHYDNSISSNLKYYQISFIDRADENISDKLMRHIIEMIQLEYGICYDSKKYIIILDDDDADRFEKNNHQYSDIQAVFIGTDVFLTASQAKILQGYNTFIIPEYYFDFELREVGELW